MTWIARNAPQPVAVTPPAIDAEPLVTLERQGAHGNIAVTDLARAIAGTTDSGTTSALSSSSSGVQLVKGVLTVTEGPWQVLLSGSSTSVPCSVLSPCSALAGDVVWCLAQPGLVLVIGCATSHEYVSFTPDVYQNNTLTQAGTNIAHTTASWTRYSVNGRRCHYVGSVTMTAAGTTGNWVRVTCPIRPRTDGIFPVGNLRWSSSGGTVVNGGWAQVLNRYNVGLQVAELVAFEVTQGAAFGATAPLTAIANNDTITWNVEYEILAGI
jgi:hypothetical protein